MRCSHDFDSQDRQGRQNRSGAVAVFTLFILVAMMVIVALAIDVGYLVFVDTELQRTADAAAIAATWRLVEQEGLGVPLSPDDAEAVRTTASRFASLNGVANSTVSLAAADVTIGNLAYPFSAGSVMTFADPGHFNAVKVRVRKTSSADGNGTVPLFFARILGVNGCDMQREATAAFLGNSSGFRTPSDGRNLDILPFALDKTTWDDLLAGGGSDDYRWDPDAKCIRNGPDGVREVNLYPQGTGSPGNRGTVDIGASNNSTADICRQIRCGISPSDLAHLGGKLEFDRDGKLYLNGDTGISAGVKDDLASILGQRRIIPVFETVAGPGNNATYTIVGFSGIRIMHVKLTGSPSQKQVMIQPARIVSRGAIPATEGAPASQFVYSPVWLVH